MSKQDKDIIARAKKIFAYCEETERDNTRLFREDLKFANGDSDNQYQWAAAEVTMRTGRPCITVNKTKQHNLQIVNELRQNPASIKISPIGNGADKETAAILDGIVRRIQIDSDFETVQTTAMKFVVDAGLGYWRVTTGYCRDDSFDQEITIEQIPDPTGVYLYGFTKPDGSDATDAFIFDKIKKSVYEDKYGKTSATDINWGGSDKDGWLEEDEIRICEYFYTETKKDYLTIDDNGNPIYLSDIEDKEQRDAIKATAEKIRTIERKSIKWCKIAGDKIIEREDWAGKYIPIVRVFGEETIIDGKTERKGNTRSMKDPARVYNYWTSSAVEFVALQGKQPYLAPIEAIEGHEKEWDNLNNENLPYLPYNSIDLEGNQIPQPKRQEPPVMASAYIQGMEIASNEIQAVTGQYDAQIGQNVNQQSGKALNAVQRRGDNATFHFTDNRDLAVRHTGCIIIDLIPTIYDTEREIRTIEEDGTEDSIVINPDQPIAYMEQQDVNGKKVKSYNLKIGSYGVSVSSGASFGTRRQEASEALAEMAARNPALMQMAGDLIFKAYDFPMADKIAERLEKTLPPELRDAPEGEEQPGPQFMAAMQQHEQQIAEAEQQIKAMDEVIQKMTEELDSKENDAKELQIKQFEAETKRIALAPQAKELQQEAQPNEYEIRKAEAETRKIEAQAREAEVKAEIAESEAMKQEIQALMQGLESLAQNQMQLQDHLKNIAKMTAIAAAPRRSEIEFDDTGLPVSSVSRPIEINIESEEDGEESD